MTDFDWVTARANCSLHALFEQLKADLAEDAKTFGNLRGPSVKCEIYNASSTSVSVILNTGLGASSVRFQLTEAGIAVRGINGQERFVGTPTLNEKKECRLKVGGIEYEMWQFRKMALEELFFGV